MQKNNFKYIKIIIIAINSKTIISSVKINIYNKIIIISLVSWIKMIKTLQIIIIITLMVLIPTFTLFNKPII